ncbi:MAG: hypothetical protein J1E06_07730 [Acutalibacter sp.]|nr:hypothetical protein [Acutalibacter sp.]
MRGEEFLEKLELIDPAFVEAAEVVPYKKKIVWVKWAAAAACLCLVLAGAFGLSQGDQIDPLPSASSEIKTETDPPFKDTAEKDSHTNTLQMWHEGYRAEDYFKFCDTAEEATEQNMDYAIDALKWQTRDFADWREKLERAGVIPVINSHREFNLQARYDDFGNLYAVTLLWSIRGDTIEEYSDLTVTVGHEEVEMIRCCIEVGVDDDGNVLEPTVTVTERDGVQIVARGGENTGKTLTFQNENGWYQISGSWNDSYQPVAELLDWFWEHPLDLEQFPMESGDEYSLASFEEMSDAFRGILPDFDALGFSQEETGSGLVLKNGMPVRFEGRYRKETTVTWCIAAEPGFYELEGCLGDLETLTREQVFSALEEDWKIEFLQDGLLVTVYPDDPNDPAEAWELIESLQQKQE